MWSRAFIVAAALLSAVAAQGADAPRAPGAGEAIFASGGIGDTELARLAALEKAYNLKLVFSLLEGNYVADVRVVIRGAAGGKAYEHFAEGPLLLARLPAGQYEVAATYEGRTLTRRVKVVDNRLRTEYLRWPSNPATDLPVSRWLERE